MSSRVLKMVPNDIGMTVCSRMTVSLTRSCASTFSRVESSTSSGATAAPPRPPFDFALAGGFRILPAPAPLLGVLIEHFADLFDQVLGQTRLGHEGVAAGLLRPFGNAGEGVAGERDDGDLFGA